MAKEISQLIVEAAGYTLFIFVGYLFYKFYSKKESKISKTARIFSITMGIILLIIGVLSLIVTIVFFLSGGYLITKMMTGVFLIGGIVFIFGGILLILVAKGKWKPKHLE